MRYALSLPGQRAGKVPPAAGPRLARFFLLLASLLEGGAGGFAQTVTPPPGPAPGASDAIRPLGPSLFPIYDHHLRTADDTEVRTILFFYHSTDRRGGGERSRLLLPLYYWSHTLSPPDRRLYLFPIFFFHRSSEEESFNFAPPFFFDRRTPASSFQFLFPLWLHTAEVARKRSIHRVLFPLFKHETDQSQPGAVRTRTRFGLKWILELFEARTAEGLTQLAGLNFFNWKRETDGGLALFRREKSLAPDGVAEERTLLFPLYYHVNRPDRNFLLGGPVYGYFAGGDKVREYYSPLVWLAEGDGGFQSLLLFPFYHRATRVDPPLSYVASHPLFHYSRTPQERNWGILFGLLYQNAHRFDSKKTIHSVLYPLGYFDVQPDGIRGHRRLLPFYLDAFNAERRFRFTFPFFWNYQTRSQRDWLWDFTLILPSYVGWGGPQDYFATGFPLYWSSRAGVRAWDLLIPLFYRQNDATSSAFYSLPYTGVNFPSQRVTAVLGGAAVHRQFFDLRGAPRGWALDLFWWLWGMERRPDGFRLRLLPLFAASREGEDRSLLLFPFLYRQWSPSRSQSYFFPVYGQHRSADGLRRRDFYALGTYVRSREENENGQVQKSREDILWSLLSFQNDYQRHLVHRRVLPLGFWQTRSVGEDREVVAPFYYSHRIQTEDETHFLTLVLGNLFLSKSVVRRAGPAPAPPAAAPPAPALIGPPPVGEPAATPAPAAPEPYYERGVLWPVSRWGQDEQGNPFQWALPFYYYARTPTEENRSFFPFIYTNSEKGPYHTGYFRYFFLFDSERFEGGRRFSAGQLLFDWMVDHTRSEKRFRLLYPVFETRFSPEGSSFQITPLFQGEKREQGGERRSRQFFFPFYFRGSTELRKPDGDYAVDARHFYLFPLFGWSKKSLRTEHDFVIPIFHLRRSLEGYAFQVRPFLFLRNDPEELSFRLWPIHSHESGEGAGEWWVSRYLYLSKLSLRRQSFSYRLDPFLFHARRSPAETSAGGLLGLTAYQRTQDESGARTTWRALPLAYGYSRPAEAGTGIFPLFYGRDWGAKEIDYAVPWRFFFIANQLRGAGERHFSLLWKLGEYTDRPGRPGYHEFRLLQELVVDRRSESSRQLSFNPLFSYYRDDTRRLVDWSLLLSIYRYREVEGLPRRTLFWIFRW